MYNHNKAQQSKNRVHISWNILYKTGVIVVIPEIPDHGCESNCLMMTNLIKCNQYRKVVQMSQSAFMNVTQYSQTLVHGILLDVELVHIFTAPT